MDSIMNWMKEFLIIYLILTTLTNLAATDQYKKHLHFFSGVVLLLVLLSPILGLFGEAGRLEALISYETFWEELDSTRQDTKKLEFLQNRHYISKYEQAIARDMEVQAAAHDLSVSQIHVSLSDDYEIHQVTVWLEAPQAADVKTFLMNTYGLQENQIYVNRKEEGRNEMAD